MKKNNENNNDNNNNDNNFPPLLPPLPQLPPIPPPSPLDGGDGESNGDDDDHHHDDDDENRNLTPTQIFLLDQPQMTGIAVGTNNAATSMPLKEKKFRFSENLSKVFPETNDIFESDHQPKILEKEETNVSNVQTMIKELNEGKTPDQLKFFSGEEKEEHLWKTQARKNVGVLSKGNEEFLGCLASKYGRDVLQTNKLKIHLESGEIYQDNINTGESLYNFLRAQEEVSKKFLNLDINLSGDLEYYIRKILDRVTDEKFNVHINSTSKFFFYRFNNFRQSFGHTQISDD